MNALSESQSQKYPFTKDFIDNQLIPALKADYLDLSYTVGINQFLLYFMGNCNGITFRYDATVIASHDSILLRFSRPDTFSATFFNEVFNITLSLSDPSKSSYIIVKNPSVPYMELIDHIIKTFKSLRS